MVRHAPPMRLMTAAERRRWLVGHWRLAVPGLSALLLVVAMTAPLPVQVTAFPQLGLLAVFVWATFQPGLMPPWVAFGVGLFADLLFGQPMGVNATLFALTAAFVRRFEARYGHHPHDFDWAMAAVVVVVFEALTGPLMALAARPMPVLPLAWQAVTTVAAYPAVVALCARIQLGVFGRPS